MATKEENIKFKEYLTKNNISEANATKADAVRFKSGQQLSSDIDQQQLQTQSVNPVQEEYKNKLQTEQLKTNIATGNFTAKEALAYNRATGNKQGAREVALGSTEALTSGNLKTSVSAPEVEKIQDMGVKPTEISPNITVDKGVREELMPNVEKTTVETPEGKTITTKETPTETKPITAETQWKDTDKSLGTLEQMVESRYGTVATQNPDGTLSAIIGDKKYQWEITPEGPRKTEVQLTQAEQIKMKAISKYMTASADELYSAMINGNITKEMEQSLMANPNYAIAKEKQSKKLSTDNINSQMEGVYNSMTGKETKEDTTIEDMSNKTVTNLESKGIDVPKFSEYIAKDETLSADVIALNSQIKTIKELKDTAEANTKRIIEQYPGISKASAILLSARQNEPLYEQIKALSYDATELQANINYRQSILEEDYKAELAQYQLQEQRAYNEEQAITNLENQYKYTYGDLDSDNPTLQNIAIKNALTDMYTKYQDIPGLESMAIKEGKVQDLIAQGMTGSQAIAQVENEIRNSQRYKQYIESAMGKDTKYGFTNVGNGVIAVTDPTTGKVEFKSQTGTGATNDLTGLTSIADKNIQCGKAVNTYIQDVTGTYGKMGDTLNSKLSALQSIGDSEGPVQGGIFVSNPLNNTVGHTGIVQSVNADGSITVLEANREGKSTGGPLVENTYSAEQVARMKFSQAPSTVSKSKYPDYIKYVEKGSLPVGMKSGTPAYEKFISEAEQGYTEAKNQSLKTKGFEITNPTAYASTSAKQKEEISTAINNVAPFIQSMDKVIALTEKYGTEMPWTEAGKKINQEIKNAQLLAKEIYNLGVLNGPDLALMESIIQNPTSAGANITMWQDYVQMLKDGKKTILDNAVSKANSVGLSSLGITTENKSTGKNGKTYTW